MYISYPQCQQCGLLCKDTFSDKNDFNNYWNGLCILDQCVVCKIIEKISKYTEYAFLNHLCVYHGKYLFTIDEESKKRNKALGFSERANRKHKLAIYWSLDELNITNNYLLLSSYLESIFYLIKNTYLAIHQNASTHPKLNITKREYLNLPVLQFKEYSSEQFNENENFFKDRSLTIPRYLRIANLVRRSANVIKHQNGDIIPKYSGKILIEQFGFREGFDFVTHKSHVIPKLRPKTEIGFTPAIAGMLYVFMNDFVSIVFNCPKLSKEKYNLEKISSKLLSVALRKGVAKRLMKELEDDAIVYFIREEDHDKLKKVEAIIDKKRRKAKVRKK